MTTDKPERSSGPALVTGATSGLGHGVAEALSERGWTVLVHGRNEQRCGEVVAKLRAKGRSAYPYRADLSSLREAARLAQQVADDHPSLGLLVNNAGVGFGADRKHRELSKDGYEMRLGVNYLAPVVLTRLLRSPLRAAGHAQVLNVGSLGQSPLDFDDPQFTRNYDGAEAYMRSKFALAAFTFMTAHEYTQDGIMVNCIHPGTYLDTGMTREAGIKSLTSVTEGIDAVLQAIRAGQHNTTGVFFNGTHRSRANDRDAYRIGEPLASLTAKLLSGVQGAEQAAW